MFRLMHKVAPDAACYTPSLTAINAFYQDLIADLDLVVVPQAGEYGVLVMTEPRGRVCAPTNTHVCS